MALTLKDAPALARRMESAAKKAGVNARAFVTTADNGGVRVVAKYTKVRSS